MKSGRNPRFFSLKGSGVRDPGPGEGKRQGVLNYNASPIINFLSISVISSIYKLSTPQDLFSLLPDPRHLPPPALPGFSRIPPEFTPIATKYARAIYFAG